MHRSMNGGEFVGVFDKIRTGLEEAISYEKGELQASTRKVSVRPVSHFDAETIKQIRVSTGMTQVVFAEFMGVSVKTVEAWESGRNQPIGSACRLLDLTMADPQFPQKAGIVSQ